MSLYNFPNTTIRGADEGIRQIVSEVPVYIPMLLMFIFFVVFLGGVVGSKKRTGYADVPLWATIAGMTALMVSLPLTLASGIIDALTLGIVVTVTLASGVWLFMSRNRNEA